MEWKVTNSSRLVREVKTPGKLLPPRLTRPRGKYRHNNLPKWRVRSRNHHRNQHRKSRTNCTEDLLRAQCAPPYDRGLGALGHRGTVLWDFPPGARPGSHSTCRRKVLSCWSQGAGRRNHFEISQSTRFLTRLPSRETT